MGWQGEAFLPRPASQPFPGAPPPPSTTPPIPTTPPGFLIQLSLLSHICSQHHLIRFTHPPALHPGSNLVKPDGQNGAFLAPWPPPPTTHCLTQPPLPCACSDLRCLHALWRIRVQVALTAPTIPPRFELFAFEQAAMQCARSVLNPAPAAPLAVPLAAQPNDKLHSLF